MTIDLERSLAAPGLFTADRSQLLGGRCQVCEQVFFPNAPACVFCRATDVGAYPLSTSGTIYSFTIVRVPVPGYNGPVPYGLGVVDLPEDGIRVTTTLTSPNLDHLAVGESVKFHLIDVGGDEATRITYAFGMEK